MSCPIGVFDSGYGGLTILKDIVKEMPEYDYIYLGDNARTPYGTRSFDVVYKYTREAVYFGDNLFVGETRWRKKATRRRSLAGQPSEFSSNPAMSGKRQTCFLVRKS